MRTIHNDTELILSLVKKEFPKFKSFLKSLNLRHGNQEILDFWFSEGAWNVETEDGEKFIVIFGKSRIHVILKKNKKFKSIKKKFFKFFPL